MERQLFGIPIWTKEYDGTQVSRLRVSTEAEEPAWGRRRTTFDPAPRLAFDYGARTIRLGTGLDEAEARMIVEAVGQRWPSLTQ